jgi:hypothetical protein
MSKANFNTIKLLEEIQLCSTDLARLDPDCERSKVLRARLSKLTPRAQALDVNTLRDSHREAVGRIKRREHEYATPQALLEE